VSTRRLRRWFLPDTPDVVGLLRGQAAATIAGLEAFTAWAGGDEAAAQALREAEPLGDEAKGEVLDALREAFVLALEPEDIFTLSRGLDWILDYSRDVIEEAEAMGGGPDPGIAEMASLLLQATREVDEAIGGLGSSDEAATAAANAAIKTIRRMEHIYYRETAKLLEVESTRERISRRELYRRCDRIGEIVVEVAERIVYAVVKES
jgi:uncharacterized protein Yka (UPF0111/DUF47 family)